MPRSRSLNRLNRLNAKRRRRSLRSAVPGLDDNSFGIEKTIDHSKDLLLKSIENEIVQDLMEPKLN